jgi:hypothetical protein
VARPTKPKADKRDAMLWVRMNEKERKIVEDAAQRDGLPASTWARVIILRAATRSGLIGGEDT